MDARVACSIWVEDAGVILSAVFGLEVIQEHLEVLTKHRGAFIVRRIQVCAVKVLEMSWLLWRRKKLWSWLDASKLGLLGVELLVIREFVVGDIHELVVELMKILLVGY